MNGAIRVYLVRRCAVTLLVLLAASVATFALAVRVPGDPARILLAQRAGEQPPTPEAVAALRKELGLDRPAWERYVRWLGGIARGDFGRSYLDGRPVSQEIFPRLGRTTGLACAASLLIAAVAWIAAVLAAAARGRAVDLAVLGTTTVLATLPDFVLGLFLMIWAAGPLGILPLAGSGHLSQYLLPALTLGLSGSALPGRLLRAQLVEEMGSGYTVAARAKGASEARIVCVHAMRNALVPFVTYLGVAFRDAVTSTPIIETMFGFRGIGTYLVDSLESRDVPALQGCVLLFVLVAALASLLTDLTYHWIDPRIRVGGTTA